MSNLFYTTFNMSLSAGVLVLAVLLLRLLAKKCPKWFHVCLWGLVAVRLICPFTVESPLSLMPKTEWIPREAVSVENPTSDIAAPNHGDTDTVSQGSSGEILTNGENTALPSPITETEHNVRWGELLSALWILGICGMLVYMFVSYGLVYRRIREAKHMGDRIFTSDSVPSPFVFGILFPRIFLPVGMDEGVLTHVIAHERVHIRRLDHWWKPIGFVLLAIHWFNPLIWLSYILLCRDIELACDERVVRNMDTAERADYSEALLVCSGNRRLITACPLAFGEISVKERIKTVLNYKKPSFQVVVLAILACAAVGVFFLTDPAAEKDTKTNTVTAYLTEDERALLAEGDNDSDKEKEISVTFRSTEVPMKAVVKITCKPHVFLILIESEEQMTLGDTKTFHIPPNCSYTVEAYCLAGENGNVTFEITETINGSASSEEGDITAEEIETLISRYFLEEDMMESLSGHSALSDEPVIIDGVPYYKATDERFDRWEEIMTLYSQIYQGEELNRRTEEARGPYKNVDGDTWVTPYGWSTVLSQQDYRYEFTQTGENTGELCLIRKEPDNSESPTVFSVVKLAPGELRIVSVHMP